MGRLGVLRLLTEIERALAELRGAARQGPAPLQVVPYRGHGTPEALYLQGRVLHGRPIPPASRHDTRWRNLLHTLRRIESDEVRGARVTARVGGRRWEARTDDEGYFRFRLDHPPLAEAPEHWHPVELELAEPASPTPARATGWGLVPPPTARFGIISDIDDTVVKTDVTNLLRMARLVLLTNAHTRLPFEGVAAFYRALVAGASGAEANPVFYVSSSPWNFYDLLHEVFEVHGIPAGPLFLKDYGFSSGKLLATGHHEHKLEAIRTILQTHPGLPFALLGDSGQEDPEIYREVVRHSPDRVRAIYIRDVVGGRRDRAIAALAAEVREAGVEMVLGSDTVSAAEHAARLGLIDPAALPAIRGERAADAAAPDPFESVVRPE